ncbi:hypothetical protein [Microbacterium sp. 13-71-7]|uniref:hypothetical protein n=1 Tax=Microbacterium sp. 13-71-7 TaxID=1970399 RepID=UPI0025CC9136|nr:hypothetical protein [Microbacterium sp. 13-71-7]
MNDYAAEFPVWSKSGLMSSSELSISRELVSDLLRWASVFQEHFDPESGWDDPSIANEHDREGDALLTRLRDELGGDFLVHRVAWEHEVS